LGKAQSRGAELGIQWQLTDSLKGDVNLSYTDAELSLDAPGLGNAGDRLPGAPKVSYTVGLQYGFKIRTLPSFIDWNVSYRGKLYPGLGETGVPAGDYYLMNARWGVSIGKSNVALFANNLTNEDELAWVAQSFSDGRAYRVRPRTVGLELSYRF